jgi:hypothetical protein
MNKFNHVLGILGLTIALHAMEQQEGPKNKSEVRVIQSASEQELKPIIEWVKKNFESMQDHLPCEDDLDYSPGYIVDVNNDGKVEYVFLQHRGTLNELMIYVFLKDGNQISFLEDNPLDENIHGDFINPLTNQSEPFVSVDGKVYICAAYHGGGRHIYLWRNGKVSLCTDSFWINQQRKLFNDLYQQHRYDDAYNFLADVQSDYNSTVDAQTVLWMRNDIALAALRAGCPYTGNKYLKSIKNDTSFRSASPALKKAIETNTELCREAMEKDQEKGTKGIYDYAWMLEYKKQSGMELISDQRIDSLFNAAVPDIHVDNYKYPDHQHIKFWRENVARHFCCSSTDEVKITNDRYVSFNGFYRHAAQSRGFMWCDIKDKVSAVVLAQAYSDDEPMVITSRSLFGHEIPPAFFQALREWMQDSDLKQTQALFYDRLGAGFRIALEKKTDE